MDQAEREKRLSEPVPDGISGGTEAESKTENLSNPSDMLPGRAEEEDNVVGALTANQQSGLNTSPLSENKNDASDAVQPVVNEANREDELIVNRVLSGDHEAFADLIDRYKVAVYNLCARMLNDPSEAEDAAQEVFLRAYNQLASYQTGRRFSTWILSIASHFCIDLLRRRKPSVDIDSIAFWKQSDLPEPEERALTGETRDEVRELLTKLPEKYRGVTVLRYWQDLSYEEIAEATGLSVGTVKTRLFRARELLAKELDKQRRSGGDASSRSDDEQLYARSKRGLLREKNIETKRNTKTLKGNQNVLP